jgi:hypothetical protein
MYRRKGKERKDIKIEKGNETYLVKWFPFALIFFVL